MKHEPIFPNEASILVHHYSAFDSFFFFYVLHVSTTDHGRRHADTSFSQVVLLLAFVCIQKRRFWLLMSLYTITHV